MKTAPSDFRPGKYSEIFLKISAFGAFGVCMNTTPGSEPLFTKTLDSHDSVHGNPESTRLTDPAESRPYLEPTAMKNTSVTSLASTPCTLPALASDILATHDSVRGVVRAKFARLLEKYRPTASSCVDSVEDLFGVVYDKLVKKGYVCSSTGHAVTLAQVIATNLLISKLKQSISRGRFVVSIEDFRKPDDEGQDCSYFEFGEASNVVAKETDDAEMKELFDAAAEKFLKLRGDIDPIDQAIFTAIADHVRESVKIPNDRLLAQSVGCRQNTLTVRLHKLQAQLQGFVQELGYVHPSHRRQESRPPASPSPKGRPGRVGRSRKSIMCGTTPAHHENTQGKVM